MGSGFPCFHRWTKSTSDKNGYSKSSYLPNVLTTKNYELGKLAHNDNYISFLQIYASFKRDIYMH